MQKEDNILSYIRHKKIKVSDSFGEDIRFIPVEIAFLKNVKSLKRRVNKAREILKKFNVEEVVYTVELNDILGETSSCGIPKGNLITSFKLLCNKLSINKCKLINIYDKELIFFNYFNAKQIIFMAERITLYTDEINSAKSIADKLFYEYGVCIDVKVYSSKYGSKRFIIDADRGTIRIEDIFTDGVIYNVDCVEYNVDLRPLADYPEICDKMKIKNLISGKNLIKIS